MTGFKLSIADLPIGIEAITDIGRKELNLATDTYNGLHEGKGRCRFTVAHELGHIFEHRYLGMVFSNGGKALRLNRGNIRPYMDPEAQANVFAAALLMPQSALKNMEERERIAQNISQKAGVSLEAARIRLKTYLRY